LSKATEGQEASDKKAAELRKSFEKLKTTSAATLEAKEKRLTSAANQKSLAIEQTAQLINAALPLLVGNPEVWKVVATDLMTRLDVTFTLKDCQITWIFYPPLTSETRYIEELIQNQTTTILALQLYGSMIEGMENTLYDSLFQLILEPTLRVASRDDGMVAQIIVQCIRKFGQWKKIPRTTEYALLILSMIQLNVQLCSRFDHVWQKMNQQDSTFKFGAVIGKFDPMIKSLYDALNGRELHSSLDASFQGRVLHFKGEHVISGVDWKWLIMIDENSQSIRLIDKSLFRLDLENSTLER
jgi:hypothetical protein